MNSKKCKMDIIKPIVFSIFYTFYFYIAIKCIVNNNIHISTEDITISNIGKRLMVDFFSMLLIPCILILIYRTRLIEFKLHFKYTFLQYSLIIIMIILFILHGDFTIRGFYKPFFYLLIVGFGEEFIFRGYVYNQLTKHNRLLAIIISGLFFGVLHAILPGVLAGKGWVSIVVSMRNLVGIGIASGYYFIYILEKSKSLYIPIFVHAIMDYSIGAIGIITIIGTGFYLYLLDKKQYSTRNLK